MTQCDRILRHLRDYGTITASQAIAEYGCQRLAARISDLKRKGYKITVSTGRGHNRYGERTAFAVYHLQEVPPNG